MLYYTHLTIKGDENLVKTTLFKTAAKINSCAKNERISLVILKFFVQITNQCHKIGVAGFDLSTLV